MNVPNFLAVLCSVVMMSTHVSAEFPASARNHTLTPLTQPGWRTPAGEAVDARQIPFAGTTFSWPATGANAARLGDSPLSLKIDKPATHLHLLHTFEPNEPTTAYQQSAVQAKETGDKPADKPTVFDFDVVYVDGTTLTVPVRWDEAIHDWQRDSFWDRHYGMLADLSAAPIAALLPDGPGRGQSYVLYAMRWPNPKPDVSISEVRLRGTVDGKRWGTPILVDITTSTTPPTGRTLYVSPEGDDAVDGSFAKPWRDPRAAIDRLQPGDTLYLRGGRYDVDQRIILNTDGAPDKPITIAGYPGETAIIDARTYTFSKDPTLNDLEKSPFQTRIGFLDISGRSNIVVRNLHLENLVSMGIRAMECTNVAIEHNTVFLSPASAIFLTGHHSRANHNVVIRACSLEAFKRHFTHDAARDTDPILVAQRDFLANRRGRGGFGDECIDVGGTGSTHLEGAYNEVSWGDKEGMDTKGGPRFVKIHHNYVHHNWFWTALYVDGWTQPLRDVEVAYNVVCNNWGSGIAVNAEQGPLVENVSVHHNLSFNNDLAGIDIGRAGKDNARRNLRIENNTVFNNGHAERNKRPAGGINLGSPNVENVVIQNNIVVGNRDYGIATFGTEDMRAGKNIIIRNNLVHPAVPDGWVMGSDNYFATSGEGAIHAEPKFLNVEQLNFRLQPGSPAIGAGHTDTGWNAQAPGPVDLGAFQYDDPR